MSKTLLIAFGVCLLVLVMLLIFIPRSAERLTNNQETEHVENEAELIDSWISEQGLNQYGDPPDTVYTGGTPLFNEQTGQTLNRYSYIRERHPDKPWLKEGR